MTDRPAMQWLTGQQWQKTNTTSCDRTGGCRSSSAITNSIDRPTWLIGQQCNDWQASNDNKKNTSTSFYFVYRPAMTTNEHINMTDRPAFSNDNKHINMIDRPAMQWLTGQQWQQMNTSTWLIGQQCNDWQASNAITTSDMVVDITSGTQDSMIW